jgi:NaMN:DMB phosphoribosyltransferase
MKRQNLLGFFIFDSIFIGGNTSACVIMKGMVKKYMYVYVSKGKNILVEKNKVKVRDSLSSLEVEWPSLVWSGFHSLWLTSTSFS